MLGGGPLAGFLIYQFGPHAAFFGSAVLFTLSVASFALVTVPACLPVNEIAQHPGTTTTNPGGSDRHVPARPRLLTRAWADTTKGFQVARGNRMLTGLLVLVGGMNLGFSGPFTAGIPLLAAANGWGARGAGLLIGAFGTGAAISGLSLLLPKQVPHAGLAQLAVVSSMGLTIAAIGLAPTLPAALTAAAALGASSGVFGTVAYTQLLRVTPTAEVGRVMALVSLILEGTATLSFLTTGTVATTHNAADTFLLGGLTIVATTLLATTWPHVRYPTRATDDGANSQDEPENHQAHKNTSPERSGPGEVVSQVRRQTTSGQGPRDGPHRRGLQLLTGGRLGIGSSPACWHRRFHRGG